MLSQSFDATIKFGLLTVALMALYAVKYGDRNALALVIALSFMCYLTQIVSTWYELTPTTTLLSLNKAMWLATLAFGVFVGAKLWWGVV